MATTSRTSRFFPNPYASASSSSARHQRSLQARTEPVPWTEGKTVDTARRILNCCVENLEARAAAAAAATTPERRRIVRRSSSSQSPRDDLYAGSMGARAYLRWRLADFLLSTSSKKQRGDGGDDDASLADLLLRDALRAAEDASERHRPTTSDHSTANSNDNSQPAKILRRTALLTGQYVGSTAMYAALLHGSRHKQEKDNDSSSNNRKLARDVAEGLVRDVRVSAKALPPWECDVLYGRAGAIQVVLFLREALDDPSLGSDAALDLASEILDEGRRYATDRPNLRMPLLWQWHRAKYLGAAHGVVGILQTLLSLAPSEVEALDKSRGMVELVRQTIAALDGYCYPSGNLESSIKDGHRSDKLVHWCHGAPGHLLLLVRAYEVLGDETLLAKAKDVADQVVWPRGLLRKGVGLCHGVSGNAYALLELGRHDETYVAKARCFLEFAVDNLGELEYVPDEPHSLYEGLAALGCLVIDMADPENARFPLYF